MMAHREEVIKHRGRSNVNRRTWNMIQAAENLAGFTFVITQGSYNKGVSARRPARTTVAGVRVAW